MENEVGPTMVGVAEPTVLELRVDNAVIRVCLKVQWVGRPGAGTPMALILTTCGTAAAFKSCTKGTRSKGDSEIRSVAAYFFVREHLRLTSN